MLDRTELWPEGTITDQIVAVTGPRGPILDLKMPVPDLKGPIPDIGNPVQDLRGSNSGPERAHSKHERVQFVLEGP